MSVQVSYGKQFLFGLFLILIILSIVEVTARIFEYSYSFCNFIDSDSQNSLSRETLNQLCYDHGIIKWNETPYRHLISNQHTDFVNINSLGFRGSEIDLTHEQFLIFIVGGSTVYGSGVSDDQTISYYLEEILQSNNLNVQVVNSGVPGINSATEVVIIQDKIMNLNPDLVIIYDGYNDLVKPYEKFDELGENDFTSKFIRLLAKNEYWRTGAAAVTVYFTLKNPENIETSSINVDHTNQKVLAWLEKINSSCENSKDKFQTMFILQPFLGTGDKELTTSEQIIYENNNHNLLVSEYKKYGEHLSLMNKCSKVIDFSNVFNNSSESIYMDFVHLSSNGNKIIAKNISDHILSSTINEINK
jgi:hypothetical protein